MNGSLGTLLPSSVPWSLSSAVTSPEDERRCALFSVGDEHAPVSRAASPAPIKVLLSTLVGSCPLPGLLWLAEGWRVIIQCLLECATRSDARAVGRRAELGISDSGWRRREASERTQAVVLLRGRSYLSYSGMLRVSPQC